MSKHYRINYVAYIDPFGFSGGGEMITRALLETGERLGHEIRRTCIYPRSVSEQFEKPDFWILADVHNMPHRWRRLPAALLSGIVERECYVHLDTAYVDVCDLDYLPCNGDGSDVCPFKARWRQGGRQCFRLRTARMYRNARLNVFMSPLHRRTVQRLLGDEVVGRYFEMRPVIDTRLFRNERRERDIEHLYVGHMNKAKGAENLARAFPDGKLVVAGLPNRRYRGIGQLLGFVPYDQLPALLNRARVFVHLPRWLDPAPRTVAEAALCGCELMTNQNVGTTSFDLDLSDPRTYDGAVEETWAAIARAMELQA